MSDTCNCTRSTLWMPFPALLDESFSQIFLIKGGRSHQGSNPYPNSLCANSVNPSRAATAVSSQDIVSLMTVDMCQLYSFHSHVYCLTCDFFSSKLSRRWTPSRPGLKRREKQAKGRELSAYLLWYDGRLSCVQDNMAMCEHSLG